MSKVDELVEARAEAIAVKMPDSGKSWAKIGALEMASYLRSPEMQRAIVEEEIAKLEDINNGLTYSDSLENLYAAWKTILESMK